MQINTIGLYNEIVKEIKQEVDALPFAPSYVCYIVSDKDGNFNKASEKYVGLKHKTSEEAGINCTIKRLTKEQFIKEMRNVMLAYEMNGYQPLRAMLQLPADEECVALFNDRVIEGAIIDVDHLGDEVLLDMWSGNFDRVPGTPRGVVDVLFEELGSLSGKKIAIVGSRSKTTGRFLIPMLQHHNATVSLYHSRSILQAGEFDKYDAVVSCVGKAGFIKLHHLGTYQKVLVDVGVSFVDGKVKGDFDTDVREHHRYTPFVNGMGALTRAMLVRNVLDSYFAR
ncbi:MAG: hypothetical protein ACRCX2_16330 [Paraclostridium sp.]